MSIGIVAMLAIIGTTFAINMRLEQKAAANYLAGIKAKTLAEAGIDHAIAVLRLYAITQAYSDIDDDWRWYGAAIKVYGTSDYSGAYEVSAVDCASRFYINDGLYLTGTSKTDRDTRLATMLQNLGAAIDNINGTDPAPIGATEGDEIINYRNSMGGFVTKEQIKETDWGGSGKIINTTDYRWLKDYITVNTWVDPDTIRPLGSAATPEVQARAPVNINTALRPVLVAVLQGVATDTVNINAIISQPEADSIAGNIISQRLVRPFTNWNGASDTGGFNAYINTLALPEEGLIKANANPNTQLNRLNPNSSWKALADKTGLITTAPTNTTEFCFNSMGYYELESTGTVTIGSDRVAQKKVRALVKLYDLWRQTTQAQFEAGTKNYASTYPEFDPNDTDILNSPSPWDGQIMIKKDSMGYSSGVIFRASFTGQGTPTNNTDDFNAQDGGGSKAATPSAGLTESSIFSAGDLYSDGVKIEGTDTLSYAAASNIQVPGTVEMWVKPYYTSGTHYFFRWDDSVNGRYIDLYDNAGTLTARFSDGATTITDTTPGSLTPGEWRHIAAAWATPSTSEVEIFVDGTTNGKTTSGVAITAPSGGTIYVGCDNLGGNQAYATIAEVRIWNTQKWTAAFTSDDLYQDSTDGTFESSSSPSIGTGRRLGTISWTESIPSGISGDIQFGIDPAGGSSFSGTYGADGGLETSIGKAGGSSVLNTDTTGTNIKYKATFSASSAPLKDTPVLDDVTITYFTPVRFFSWQEVAE